MTDSPTDAEIFARLKAGDMSACQMCVEEHSDDLYRLAYRMLGDEQAAEDTVQDTFLNAFKALEQFDGRSTLGTWLFRIAYNNALMHLRAQKPSEPLEDDTDALGNGITPIVVPWRETPEEIVARRESAAQLEQAIDDLPESLRTVFQLRDVQELSTAETAEIVGISQGAVKVRLHRARLLLREKLSGDFGAKIEPLPATMTCEQLTPYLSDYIDKAVGEPLAAVARDHIVTCSRCHILLDTTQKTITLMQSNRARVIPAQDRAALYAEIEKAFSERQRRLENKKPAG